MLEIKDLFVSYGMMEVLHGISLKVEDRELVSVIGPNGAGKSTLIPARSSTTVRTSPICRPTSGRVSASGTCPKAVGCSPSSPWRRTCAWAPTS